MERREIKFRAWDENEKCMFSWEDLIEMWTELGFTDNVFRFKHWVPMQYTNLKDKNGTEIYEGDICLWKAHRLEELHWVVDVRPEGAWGLNREDDRGHFYLAPFLKQIEVIGNIHEGVNQPLRKP